MDRFAPYHEAVQYLETLQRLPTKPYLRDRTHPEHFVRRTRYLLDRLGSPDRGVNIIHITGTAGKGSVSARVQAMLCAAGKSSGLFLSPYPTTLLENIVVGRRYVSPDDFVAAVEQVKSAVDDAYLRSPYGGPSYFETLFAVALVVFRQHRCRWAVVEVGLGGRFDATNAVRRKKIAAITTIGLDHTEILGRTLAAIARDKAGIIKPGCQFYTTEKRAQLLAIFRETCATQSAAFHHVSVADQDETLAHARSNNALARSIGQAAGLSEQAIRHGLQHAFLPCRFETMQHHPRVIIDGAHNPPKIATVVANLRHRKARRVIAVVAISNNKNWRSMLRLLAPAVQGMVTTRMLAADREAADPHQLGLMARRYARRGTIISAHYDPWQALDHALRLAGKNGTVLITGSFYLAGELRKRWYSEEWILQHRTSVRTRP